MASTTNELAVASWIVGSDQDPIALTRFELPDDAYQAMADWCQERNPNRRVYQSIVLRGLSEMLGFFVPEIAYFDARHRRAGDNRQTLALYLLGEPSERNDLQSRVSTAINVWLSRIYPDKPAEIRRSIAQCAQNDSNWKQVYVSADMAQSPGACPTPVDRLFYNAILVKAVDHLSGREVTFASGEAKTLIRRTPQSSLYGGIELVAFPPKQSVYNDGLYTEVVTLSVANFPERQQDGLHILARPSIRNWGPIHGYHKRSDPSRSLDIFMPPRSGELGLARYQHTSFSFRAVIENMKGVIEHNEDRVIVPRWASQDDQELFDMMRALTGSNALEGKDLMEPVRGDTGLWILPQLAPGSGDRFLAGGSGVGWPDRRDIAKSLDSPMSELGLLRAPFFKRIRGQHPITGPFEEGTASDRRKAVLKALQQNDVGSTLEIAVLHTGDATPQRVRQAAIDLLGAPSQPDSEDLVWKDGLTVRIIGRPAGPFAQLLPEARLTDDERADFTRAQIGKVLSSREAAAEANAGKHMTEHLSALSRRTSIGCAIVEMSESFKGNARDPYRVGRRILSQNGLLPQIVLVAEDGPEEKYKAAFEDCLRMLGVIPIDSQHLKPYPAALLVAQRDSTARQAAVTLPIAARVTDHGLECSIPDPHGDPVWQPYAQTALALYGGEFTSASRQRNADNDGRVQAFVTQALEHIDARGPNLTLLDARTLRRWTPGLENANLTFDTLDTGQRVFAPSDLPNSCLVRVNTDEAKLPSYYPMSDTQWPSGAFGWAGWSRTIYCLKAKPAALKTVSRASLVSRNTDGAENTAADKSPRKASALDELCLVIAQQDQDVKSMLLRAHRLRQRHVQYGGHTRLPFPLHELESLGGALA